LLLVAVAEGLLANRVSGNLQTDRERR
jgi:hypothetical protein